MNEERILTAESFDEDKDLSLRPKKFKEYIGQNKVKDNLKVFIEAAIKRKEPLEHLIFYGPPGLGKTTLANVIANELSVNIKTTSGPVIERAGDLAAILTNLEEGDVLFIDEIHRLNKTVEEILYPAMEDFELDIMIGKGPSARSVRIDVQRFTLIGATTRVGLLSSPLRSRFGIFNKLEFYSDEQLISIIERSADLLAIKIDKTAASELAKRSRGTPRIANRLLRRARDWAQIKGQGIITLEITRECLTSLEIDEIGLDLIDRRVIQTIIQNFNGGPVGLDTLAATIAEDARTIEEFYEPYLLQLGFLERTPRGRKATPGAYQHLGLIPKTSAESMQDTLF